MVRVMPPDVERADVNQEPEGWDDAVRIPEGIEQEQAEDALLAMMEAEDPGGQWERGASSR